MADNSAGFHEAAGDLRPETRDRHRGIVSLMEELEAVDWYDQRIDATDDESLRRVLAHNRDEEKEHAAMNLEWLRRADPSWDEYLRLYLFTEAPITEVEAEEGGDAGGDAAPAPATGSLGLGALHDKEGL